MAFAKKNVSQETLKSNIVSNCLKVLAGRQCKYKDTVAFGVLAPIYLCLGLITASRQSQFMQN